MEEEAKPWPHLVRLRLHTQPVSCSQGTFFPVFCNIFEKEKECWQALTYLIYTKYVAWF